MKSLYLPPFAAVLLESMRAIGYDAPTAVADIVDNSITAEASRISIRFEPGRPRVVAILDDGTGMSEDQLQQAMRHGSRSPSELRPPGDLGRFGLGLKTASLSQCRRLIVVSKKGDRVHGMTWDLDDVGASRDWNVGVFDPEEIDGIPYIAELRSQPRGTLVVWEKLDILAEGDPGDGSVLGDRMRQVGEHLGLVFHRFLGRSSRQVSIDINLEPVIPQDPFLENDGSTLGEEETIRIEGHPVVLRPFTLPHISRLDKAQIQKAGGEAGLRRLQGFYVYRDHRLIVWGTWFKLSRKEELTKLTRVRVDVPNALDHLWGLDIKKSLASPPAALRSRLSGLMSTMVNPSRQAHQYRGRVSKSGIRSIWQRIEDRSGIRYEIDREHPIVAALRASADSGVGREIDNVLRAVAESLPIEALYNDRANDQIGHKADRREDDAVAEHLEELARQMLAGFSDQRDQQQRLLAALGTIEPFALHPKLTAKLQARLEIP